MTVSPTQFVHASRDFTDAHVPALDFSTTYPIGDPAIAAQSLHELAYGARSAANPVYARLYNPTVAHFEKAMAHVESGTDAIAFSTGMAAITATLLTASMRGAHIVAVRPLYGGTDHLLASGFAGLETTFCEPADLAAAIRPDTGLVILETPANPTLKLADIRHIATACGDVPLLVDSTFATPVLQNPLTLGATLVVHSATKYIGGHGDVMGGVVVTSDADWAANLRSMRATTGALLHPLGGYLLHRGLQTLPVRIERAQSNALEIVEHLLAHPLVSRVHYPTLTEQAHLVGTQMSGPGAMIAFEVESMDTAQRVMQAVNIITPAVSLGSTDSLIQHPASLTHQIVAQEGRAASGVSDCLLRLSVGLESPTDLWKDLDEALHFASSTRSPMVA